MPLLEPTERVRLRIVPINPRDELNLVDYDEHDDQEYLYDSISPLHSLCPFLRAF